MSRPSARARWCSAMGDTPADTLLVIVNLRGLLRLKLTAQPQLAAPPGMSWTVLLDSEDARYGGSVDVRATGSRDLHAMFELPHARALLLGLAHRLSRRRTV